MQNYEFALLQRINFRSRPQLRSIVAEVNSFLFPEAYATILMSLKSCSPARKICIVRIDWKKKLRYPGYKIRYPGMACQKAPRLHSTKDLRMTMQILFRVWEKHRNAKYNSNLTFAVVCAMFRNFAPQHHSLSQRVNFDVKVFCSWFLVFCFQ